MKYAPYYWHNEPSQVFLKRDYLPNGQTIEQRVRQIANRAEDLLGVPGFGSRFAEYVARGWYSLSSPVWTNFGNERGLPISCFGSYVEDTMDSLLGTHLEVGIMSKNGGGTSAFFGEVRPRGSLIKGGLNGRSSGAVHFMQLYDKVINIVSQGSSRRGQCAVYLPIDHPDIEEFLTIRTEGSPIQSLSTGVCVSDEFMEKMIAGDPTARSTWALVLSSRAQTGYPYIFFSDNANKGRPKPYRDNERRIHHSNLCTEIMLPNGPKESFVCNLSSMNILHYDEWKDTDAVETLTYFLDAVMTEFIMKSRSIKGLERANRFARRHRALGIGWLGWHSYLQSKLIPFESMEAKSINREVAETIHNQALKASRKLAREFGEPDELGGTGLRNATLMAIAPTKSSSFILGQVSEGVEPIRSNYHIRDVQKGKYTIRNEFLEAVLASHGRNDEATWRSILENEGSVQHLGFLSDNERAVFKTFAEISPREIITQAAIRQKFIDQGQSINLLIGPEVLPKDLNTLLIDAWRMGIKSLYYQISVNAAQKFVRDINACANCEA